MTIRGYIEGRAAWVRILGCIWIVGALIALVVVFPAVSSTNTVRTLGGAILLGVGICNSLAALTKCPRCGVSLRDVTYKAANPFADDMPDCCPKCGVSLDEPMEGPGNRQ
jgi:hypothetical protein